VTDHDWTSDGRLHLGVGIEDTFIAHEDIGQRKLDEYELTQHYENWREDLSLAAEAGAEFIRWGIPWYLVEPEQGVFDWRWLDEVAEHFRKIGLTCVVDLMHYGTPLWLDNAFANGHYAERVAAYGRAVAERYAGVFDYFTPLNEPVVNALYCGENGVWPPRFVGDDGFAKIIAALAKGIVLTQREIAAVNPAAKFVHVDAGFRWANESPTRSREFLEERRFIAMDLVTGRVTPEHPLYDYLRDGGVTAADLEWLVESAVSPDVVGVNYYPGFTTLAFREDGTEHGVEAGTAGLRELLHAYHDRYGLPLALTETSRGASVAERITWLDESISTVTELRDAGLPIVGYTWFPFFTLVDWLYRQGTKPADHWFVHMGLVDLERGADSRLTRKRTDAFGHFQEIARSLNAEERSEVA
jgi:beta-glucosidase/6-phospho-beta-glucosidase/beta-galactosidase